MGGGRYYSDVAEARRAIGTTRRSNNAFDYSRTAHSSNAGTVHPDLDISGKIRECRDSEEHPLVTPIVVAMDVTSSRGDDTRKIYQQVPSMLGSIITNDIVSDPTIMWVAVGDANSDRAPLQVGQFEADRRIDEQLQKIWMEEGGGGTGEESYELVAYYLSHRTQIDAIDNRGEKGFLFFTADEAPYETVSAEQIRKHIGRPIRKDVPSTEVFEDLQKRFHTYVIYPGTTAEERSVAIDSEIRQRLEEAGGRFQDVDIRASLIWHNRNDLDLHCKTPGGSHIYYGDKHAPCGGELDVDRNVRGETSKPVENIRWARGDARPGKYEFWVENFGYHETDYSDQEFKVEIDINGEIQTVDGRIPANKTGSRSRQKVLTFNYKPAAESLQAQEERYADYNDEVILAKWEKYLPPSHILRVADPSSAVEVMLGVMAIQSGNMTLEVFLDNMKTRRVKPKRRQDVEQALTPFSAQGIFQQVDEHLFT